jgi:hypothetical protein
MKQLAFLVLLTFAASTARAGSLWTEFFDCSPEYKLFSLSWAGPWIGNARWLQQAKSNWEGDWSTMYPIPESGCVIPITNLRWYRVRVCGDPCRPDSNAIWVPNVRCTGGGAPNVSNGMGR